MAEENTETTGDTQEAVEGNTLLTEETSDENTTTEGSDVEAKEQSDSPADEKADKAETEEKAPEAYSDFTMPEGVEIDTAQLEEFLPVAKELNLTQDKAQKLVDLVAKVKAEDAAKQQEAWAQTITEWRETATKDSEIGGPKFQENVGLAKKALDTFGNEAVKEALNQSGMGNHPEIIRMFVNIGKEISNDSFVFGKSNEGGPKDPASILFPNQK